MRPIAHRPHLISFVHDHLTQVIVTTPCPTIVIASEPITCDHALAKMYVFYLDQNAVVDVTECRRPSKANRLECEELRSEIERVAASGIAVFPYSEIHLAEAGYVKDPESRAEQIKFWTIVSGGYRFNPESAIQDRQVTAILDGDSIRFERQLAVQKCGLTFEEEIEYFDPIEKSEKAAFFRDLAIQWAGRRKVQLTGKVHKDEASSIARMVLADLSHLLRTGQFPKNRIMSDHNSLFTTIAWHFTDKGSPTSFEDALVWLQAHVLELPALLIKFLGIELIAEQLATDAGKHRLKVENSQLDHDLNDLRAAAHFFPYCDAVYTDRKMATNVLPRLSKVNGISSALRARMKSIHCKRSAFIKFLRELPLPEKPPSITDAIRRTAPRMLIYIPTARDQSIGRERIESIKGMDAEIIPGEGLRIDAHAPSADWTEIISEFRRLFDKFDEVGGEGDLYAFETIDTVHLIHSRRIAFGILTSEHDDLAQNISTLSGRQA